MDEGRPFRVSQSTGGGRPSGRPEPVRRPPEEPRSTRIEQPNAVQQVTAGRGSSKKDKPSKWYVWPLIVVAIILALLAGWWAWSNLRGGVAIDDSKYQAVSITDGQVYFGKLSMLNDEYVKLSNAYYLQAQVGEGASSEETAEAGSDQNSVKLIKLSNKIYGPEDEIIIPKSQVMSFENLKPDGQVAQWLDKNAN